METFGAHFAGVDMPHANEDGLALVMEMIRKACHYKHSRRTDISREAVCMAVGAALAMGADRRTTSRTFADHVGLPNR